MSEYFINIDNEYIQKWQKMLNAVAQIAQIPAALIMKIVDENIEVYIASQNSDNPYLVGERARLEKSGLYCETTIKNNSRLIVPNALRDPLWKNNPDILLNMVSYLGFPIHYPDKSPFGTICVLDRKENTPSSLIEDLLNSFRDAIETDLALIANNAKLEMLLKEVHHRVKNNIASIASFLNLQSGMTENKEAKAILQQAISRVDYMDIVYRRLLIEDNNYEKISINEYISDLVDAIIKLFSRDNARILVLLELDRITVNTSLALNIGLIINEIVTNSLKYAFPENEKGEIAISLKNILGKYELIISDNGKGFPHDFSLKNSNGFGLSIVKMIVEQIKGTIELLPMEGAKYRIVWNG